MDVTVAHPGSAGGCVLNIIISIVNFRCIMDLECEAGGSGHVPSSNG